MKGNASRQDELPGIGKKRKPQDEQLEMPPPKQICLDYWHLSTEPKKIENDEAESDTESTNSNTFRTSSDSFMLDQSPETRTSDEPSTSSPSWATTLYSSSINSSSTKQDSLSIKEQHECEFGKSLDLDMPLYGEIQNCTDEELDDLLKEVTPSNGFILSSGRWSVNQDAQHEGKKKLTIDKEFEQYFSMLML